MWALVYEEHYIKYCLMHHQAENDGTFQAFLKEVGTPSLSFAKPAEGLESNYMLYKEAPLGSCIRLRTPQEYATVIRRKLYPESDEKPDKSRRTSSCSLM